MPYVKSIGIEKNGRIKRDTSWLRNTIAIAKAISETRMKIMSMAKTLLASVKMAPLSKNSCNLDKYFS